RQARLPDVPPGRDGRGTPGQPGSRQLQVHDHHARNHRMTRTAAWRAAALTAAVLCATLAVRPVAIAEPSRFVPWTDAPPAAVVLNDLAGRPTTMADYRGKVVLVSFWASWCEFCREQMLAMRELEGRLVGQPFEIVAVNFGESPPKVREYVKSLSVDFPV